MICGNCGSKFERPAVGETVECPKCDRRYFSDSQGTWRKPDADKDVTIDE